MKKLLLASVILLAGCDSDVDLTGHWTADQCNTKPLCSFTITGEPKKPQSLYIKFDDVNASRSASGHLVKGSKGTYTVKAPTGDYTLKLKGDDLYGVNNTKYHKDMKNPNLPGVDKEAPKSVSAQPAVAAAPTPAATGEKKPAIQSAPVPTIQTKPGVSAVAPNAPVKPAQPTIGEKPKPTIQEKPTAIGPKPTAPAATATPAPAMQPRPAAIESKPAQKPAMAEKPAAIESKPVAMGEKPQ